jgi:hypothetical protein
MSMAEQIVQTLMGAEEQVIGYASQNVKIAALVIAKEKHRAYGVVRSECVDLSGWF